MHLIILATNLVAMATTGTNGEDFGLNEKTEEIKSKNLIKEKIDYFERLQSQMNEKRQMESRERLGSRKQLKGNKQLLEKTRKESSERYGMSFENGRRILGNNGNKPVIRIYDTPCCDSSEESWNWGSESNYDKPCCDLIEGDEIVDGLIVNRKYNQMNIEIDQDGDVIDQDGDVIDQDGDVIDQDGDVIDQDGDVIDQMNSEIDQENIEIDQDVETYERNIALQNSMQHSENYDRKKFVVDPEEYQRIIRNITRDCSKELGRTLGTIDREARVKKTLFKRLLKKPKKYLNPSAYLKEKAKKEREEEKLHCKRQMEVERLKRERDEKIKQIENDYLVYS